MYKYLLWDIDGTVLNFLASQAYAIRFLFKKYNLGECSDQMLKQYSAINAKYWQMLERGELTKQEILIGRFREFFELEGLDEMERNSIKDAVRSLDFNELAPHVTINGDTATFTCAYWNQFSGLYKMETIFERVGSHIHCVSQNKTSLVPHLSSIM